MTGSRHTARHNPSHCHASRCPVSVAPHLLKLKFLSSFPKPYTKSRIQNIQKSHALHMDEGGGSPGPPVSLFGCFDPCIPPIAPTRTWPPIDRDVQVPGRPSAPLHRKGGGLLTPAPCPWTTPDSIPQRLSPAVHIPPTSPHLSAMSPHYPLSQSRSSTV